MELILSTAARLLGQGLSDPVDLGGSRRSTVLRARTAAGRSVVIKQYADGEGAAGAFSAETAGLAFTDSGPLRLGPRLLAADPESLMIVMSDLGEHPSVADRLLGDRPEPAVEALRTWAVAYGQLAASTAGRQGELAQLVAAHSRPARPPAEVPWFASHHAQRFLDRLTELGIGWPAGLASELDALSEAASADAASYAVFSPGDICADNNLLTPDGFAMIDFEAASFHSLFMDAAYATMPFPTCWCSFALAPGLATELVECYRAQVVATFPELAGELVWQQGLRRAVTLWTLRTSAGLLGEAVAGDRPMHRGRPSPSARQVLRYRWQSLLDAPETGDELPALARCLENLLAQTVGWNAPRLPLYPAFRPELPTVLDLVR